MLGAGSFVVRLLLAGVWCSVIFRGAQQVGRFEKLPWVPSLYPIGALGASIVFESTLTRPLLRKRWLQ